MADKTILAIDQGTTSSRAILFSERGDILEVAQKELTLHYPHKGWVEQSAVDIWNDTLEVTKQVLEKAKTAPEAIGITNQRETTVVWDKNTGEPVYNAIVWQDRRTADLCKDLKGQGHEPLVSKRTGLLLDPYFSATKIAWILDNVDGARKKADAGDLLFGTIDTWLLWKLSDGDVHATDVTNASRTMLCNLITRDWDDELLKLFDIPKSMLPEIKENVSEFAKVKKGLLPYDLTVGGIAGDQQAALIGQACFEEGMVKSTYGTGCFALMNIGRNFKQSQNKLLTTIAYTINGDTRYAIEGSIFVAGAAIQWLRDDLGFFKNAAESEQMATSVDDNNGVYFVPAFTGLGAPHWKPEAQAIISGLTRESNKQHITRAALEAQAYQTMDLMGAMSADSAHTPEVIRADGGLVANNFVCQFIADMLDVEVQVPVVAETTALGAAYLAGLYAGVYETLDDIKHNWKSDRKFKPQISSEERKKLADGWKTAIGMVLSGA